MAKLKSLMNTNNMDENKEPEPANSTPKQQTAFRRNSRIMEAPPPMSKLEKLNSELNMDSIKEIPEKLA